LLSILINIEEGSDTFLRKWAEFYRIPQRNTLSIATVIGTSDSIEFRVIDCK
jgi:hypothetical protein